MNPDSGAGAPLQISSISELARRVAIDPQLADRLKADPQGTLAAMVPPLPDTLVYRLIVGSLGLVLVLSCAGAIAIAFASKTPPDLLTALGSAAVGALAGLLAPSPLQRS